jgi:hypothetical protein
MQPQKRAPVSTGRGTPDTRRAPTPTAPVSGDTQGPSVSASHVAKKRRPASEIDPPDA